MFGLLPFLALLTAQDKIPVQPLSARRAIAAALQRHSDSALVDANPQLARRAGEVLWVGQGDLAYGFADEGDCDSFSHCERYRLDGVWKSRVIGVSAAYYEDSSYYLFDGLTRMEVGTRPVPSPSGNRLFIGWLDEAGDGEGNGISIWQIEGRLTRLRLIDVPIVAFDSFVAWHGEGCVEFTGRQGYGIAPTEPRHFWLTADKLDWTLHDSRPPNCSTS